VIHDGKYAGTWSHDDVGGHLFGRVEKLAEPDEKKGPPSDAPSDR
jgi:hypothetical protein